MPPVRPIVAWALPVVVGPILVLASCSGAEFSSTSSGGASGAGSSGGGGTSSVGGATSGGASSTGGTPASGGKGGGSSGGTTGSGGAAGAVSSLCPAGGLTEMDDDFEAGLDPNDWSAYGPVGVSGGRLVLKPGQNAGSSAGVITQKTFDVAGCMVWAELSPFAAGVPGDVSLMVSVDGTLDVELWVEQNPTSPSGRDIVFSVEQNSNENNQKKPYDPTNHRWLRIRFPGQQVVFETSPDGKAWTVQREAQRPGSLTKAHIELAANVWSWSDTVPSGSFDNVNVAPP